MTALARRRMPAPDPTATLGGFLNAPVGRAMARFVPEAEKTRSWIERSDR